MPLTMALAPNGAAAVTTSRLLPPDIPAGYTQDPYDHTHLWVGRERQDTAPSLTNTLLDQRQENWLPPGDSELKASLLPDRTITMPAGSGSMAGKTAQMPPPDGYLLAMAAADVLLRNLKNGMAVATFPDKSKAYLIPKTKEVRETD